MRDTFIDELVALAAAHPHIALVVGDLGYSVIEPFADRYPERFINAGVAEQNMAGLAAGLASEGYHVFTYSIANGLAFGFISYTTLKLVTGRHKEVHPAAWVIAALFLVRFVWLPE